MTSAQTPHSLGIAQKIYEDFFPKFDGHKDELVGYFGEGASVVFQENKKNGIKEIKELFDELPNLKVNVASYDVQTIQSPKSWTMIVFTGAFEVDDEDGEIKDFHCSMFVEALEVEKKAFIRYMTFTYY